LTTPTTERYLDGHVSWNNAQNGQQVPILSSTFREPFDTDMWRAWDAEIIAVQTTNPGSAAIVWRFAHNRSNALSDIAQNNSHNNPYFWYEPNAIISQDGRWALFTSNWERTLGTASDSQNGDGLVRTDVFLLELKPQ